MKVFKTYCSILFALAFILISVQASFSQEKENKLIDDLFFGGSFGVTFGSITQVDISPLVGYMFTDKFAGGFGATYQYYRDSDFDFNTHIYGGRLFGRYLIKDNVFAHAEYELLSLETQYFDNLNLYSGTERFLISSVLVGGGYRQQIGSRSFFNIMLLWNLNESSNSPYRNPIIRLGFNF